jgi:hypothetical protein
MKKTDFIIVEKTWYNEYGTKKESYYFIKQKKRVFGIPYTSTITHTVGSISGTWQEALPFQTLSDAEQFIDEVLLKNIPREKYDVNVIDRLMLITE